MYDDDLVIYCNANESEVGEVVRCLNTYCEWTIQRINLEKSVVHFSNNVYALDSRVLCQLLPMSECNHTSLYFGTSFCKMGSKMETFKCIMEKLENRLAGWKQKTLSLTGCTVLIKSIAMTLPSYIMQTFLLPTNLCEKIDRLIRGFWWQFGNQKRRLCLRAWDLICTPKLARGLEIQRMKDINLAFVTKL